MTNSEKFKEVFGFAPNDDACCVPVKVCIKQIECEFCPFDDWWSKEYKECFELKEEYEQ